MAHWTELLEQVGNGGVLDPGRLGPAFNVPRLIGVLTSCPTPFDELWKEFTIEAIVSCSDPTLVAALASGDMQAMAIALVDIRAVSQLGSDICPNPMAEMHRAAATAQPQSMVALGTQSQLVHLVYPQSRAQLPPPCVIREPLVRPYPLSHVRSRSRSLSLSLSCRVVVSHLTMSCSVTLASSTTLQFSYEPRANTTPYWRSSSRSTKSISSCSRPSTRRNNLR